jgi:aspartate aminotransferase
VFLLLLRDFSQIGRSGKSQNQKRFAIERYRQFVAEGVRERAGQPENDAFVEDNRKQLVKQRATALQLIQKIPGLSCVVPEGGFYLFPDVSSLFSKSFKGERIGNVDRLAEMLLEHAHIAIVPGSAFGWGTHIRISYAIPDEEIVSGLTRLGQFVQSLS